MIPQVPITMRLSENTITILKNFAAINENIYFRKGDIIRTVAESGNMVARAKISEIFDTEFAIYNLNEFMNGLRLFKTPEIQFNDEGKNKFALIREGSSHVKYMLTPPSLVKYPENRDLVLPSKDVCFQMSEDQFERLIKASNIFGFPDITVIGEQGIISVLARNKENPTSNSVSIDVGETSEEFVLNFKVEYLTKIISGSYDVVISKELISQFDNQNYELTYYVGLEHDSSFSS